MEFRLLGHTGLQVSALGFGASPLGGSFGSIDESEGIRAVRTALDLGINVFDVSPYYGLGRAETALGRGLQGAARSSYVLATKTGRFGDRLFDFSADRIVRSCEESLLRLGVDYLDILQCHDVEFVKLDQVIDEAIPALRLLQEQGKVRFVGITGLPLSVYRTVLARTDLDVILSYCHYTLFDTTLLDLIPLLEERGVGVMNAAPFAMGLLTNRPLPDWHPAPSDMRERCAAAATLWYQRGFDIAELALRFSFAEPRIATTFVGMASEEDVRRNVAWAEKPADPGLMESARRSLWDIRNRTWSSGLPENN